MAEKVIRLGVHNSGSKECPMTFYYLAAPANLIDPSSLPIPGDDLAVRADWPHQHLVRHSMAQLVLGFPNVDQESLREYATVLASHLGGIAVDPTVYRISGEADLGLEETQFAPGFGPESAASEVA